MKWIYLKQAFDLFNFNSLLCVLFQLIMVIPDGPPVNDVVLVVESTANLGPYMDELKSAYILPILQ